MDAHWIFVCLFIIFWIGRQPTFGHSMVNYIQVLHVPGATSVITIPFVSQKQHCADKCSRHGSCYAFLMVATEVHPCQLLIGLDGSRTDPDPNIETFVSLHYDGIPHIRTTQAKTWSDGVALCQSKGMTMVSYPLTMDKRNWLLALNIWRLLIAAMKNPADNYQMYDMNTNNPLVVDWNNDEGSNDYNAISLLLTGKFLPELSVYDLAAEGVVTLICQPLN